MKSQAVQGAGTNKNPYSVILKEELNFYGVLTARIFVVLSLVSKLINSSTYI